MTSLHERPRMCAICRHFDCEVPNVGKFYVWYLGDPPVDEELLLWLTGPRQPWWDRIGPVRGVA